MPFACTATEVRSLAQLNLAQEQKPGSSAADTRQARRPAAPCFSLSRGLDKYRLSTELSPPLQPHALACRGKAPMLARLAGAGQAQDARQPHASVTSRRDGRAEARGGAGGAPRGHEEEDAGSRLPRSLRLGREKQGQPGAWPAPPEPGPGPTPPPRSSAPLPREGRWRLRPPPWGSRRRVASRGRGRRGQGGAAALTCHWSPPPESPSR